MSEETQSLPLAKKEKSFFSGLLKFLFFAIAMIAVMLTVMANMGGSSDTLRESLEKFISSSLEGRYTTIKRLNRVSFFPVLGVDIEGLEVKETSKSKDVDLSAKKVRIFITFWGLITKRTRFTSFLVEDLKAKKGVLGRKSFSIDKIYIDHDKGTKEAYINGYGSMDSSYKWAVKMKVQVLGSIGSYKYAVGKQRPFDIEVGDIKFSGVLSDRIKDYVRIGDIYIGAPDPALKGFISLSLLEGNLMKLIGSFTAIGNNDDYKPDLIIEFSKSTPQISGKFESDVLHVNYLNDGKNSPIAVIERVFEVFENDGQDKGEGKDKSSDGGKSENDNIACRYGLNVDVAIKKLITKDKTGRDIERNNVEFLLTQKDGIVELTPKKGDIEAISMACESVKLTTVRHSRENKVGKAGDQGKDKGK